MNKKGFSLVELLAVIIVLSIISLIAVRGYSKIMKTSAEKQLNEKIMTIEKAAMSYGQDNRSEITNTCTVDGKSTKCLCKTVEFLITNKYIESDEKDSSGNPTLINSVTKADMKSDKVLIYRNNNRVYALYNDSQCS